MADEVVLHAVGGDQGFVALLQRALVALGIRHVGERQQGGAIGERHRRVVDDGVVGANHLPFEGIALFRERRGDAADAVPRRSVLVVDASERNELVDVRTLGEHAPR